MHCVSTWVWGLILLSITIMLTHAIINAIQCSPPLPVGLRDIIEEIQTVNDIQLTVPDDHQKMLLEFRRKHVVQDALRHAMKKKFSPEKSLKVLIACNNAEYFT